MSPGELQTTDAERATGVFVTGTDTGVGKSIVAAALIAALTASGRRVVPCKPLLSGLDDAADPVWGYDHELLARAAGVAPERVALHTYGPAVSPHLAARWVGDAFTAAQLAGEISALAAPGATLVVEGAGGLLVPISSSESMLELAAAVGLPIVIAARPGLGTINHTLLTISAARAAGLPIAGVVITPWAGEPSPMELDNRDTIAAAGVPVALLPEVAGPSGLAAAGAAILPLLD